MRVSSFYSNSAATLARTVDTRGKWSVSRAKHFLAMTPSSAGVVVSRILWKFPFGPSPRM